RHRTLSRVAKIDDGPIRVGIRVDSLPPAPPPRTDRNPHQPGHKQQWNRDEYKNSEVRVRQVAEGFETEQREKENRSGSRNGTTENRDRVADRRRDSQRNG